MERWLILPLLCPAWQSHVEPSSAWEHFYHIQAMLRSSWVFSSPGRFCKSQLIHPIPSLHLLLAAYVWTQAVYSRQSPSYRHTLLPHTKLSTFAKWRHSDLFRPEDVNPLLKIWLSGSGQNLLDQASSLASSTLYVAGTFNYLHSPRIHQNFSHLRFLYLHFPCLEASYLTNPLPSFKVWLRVHLRGLP